MQLNKTQSFSNLLIFILSPWSYFPLLILSLTAALQAYCIHFLFIFIFPSFSHALPYFWAQLFILCFPVVTRGKESTFNAEDTRDTCSILGWEGSYGVRNGRTLQYSCLENSVNRGSWWAMLHDVTKIWHDCATACMCYTL